MADKPLKSLTFPGLSDTYTIPESTSDLINDSGFISSPATADLAMGGNKVTGLGAPVNTGDAATKGYVDNAISGLGTVFNIKGDVATVADLPASGNTVGDVYYVQAVSAAFIWLETTAHPTGYWEEFGEPIDLSGYIEKPASASAGQFLVFDGTDWVAQTVPSANGVNF